MPPPPRPTLFPYTTLFRSKPYDFSAMAPIVEGAGGVATDWQGKPLSLASDGRVPVAGDPRGGQAAWADRKSTSLNPSHVSNSHAVFRWKKKTEKKNLWTHP